MTDEQEAEAAYAEWSDAPGADWERERCTNCGSMRVIRCVNGKHKCGKCDWVVEDQALSPWDFNVVIGKQRRASTEGDAL